RDVARVGRRDTPVARGASHAGHGEQVGDVLALVDLVERGLVIVGYVHPDQVQETCGQGSLLTSSWRAIVCRSVSGRGDRARRSGVGPRPATSRLGGVF